MRALLQAFLGFSILAERSFWTRYAFSLVIGGPGAAKSLQELAICARVLALLNFAIFTEILGRAGIASSCILHAPLFTGPCEYKAVAAPFLAFIRHSLFAVEILGALVTRRRVLG